VETGGLKRQLICRGGLEKQTLTALEKRGRREEDGCARSTPLRVIELGSPIYSTFLEKGPSGWEQPHLRGGIQGDNRRLGGVTELILEN